MTAPKEEDLLVFTQEQLDAKIAEAIRKAPRRHRLVWIRAGRSHAAIAGLVALLGIVFMLAYTVWNGVYAAGQTPPTVRELKRVEAKPLPAWSERLVEWRGEIAFGLAFLLLAFACWRLWRRRRVARGIKRAPWVLATILGLSALAVGAVALWALLGETSKLPPAEQPRARIEVYKTAATVVLGTSGIGGLFIGARRFWVTETDKLDEKFYKAIDQFTSGHGAVRVSGMVALGRLAQKNPEFKGSAAHILDYLASDAPEEEKEKEIARTLLHAQRAYMPWVTKVYDRDITG